MGVRVSSLAFVISLGVFVSLAIPTRAQLALESVATGLIEPVMLTGPAGDGTRLYVLERQGTVRIIENGQLLDAYFLDIRDRAGAEEEVELLGMAFHPAYAQNGLFFVNYTHRAGNITMSRISRFGTLPESETAPRVADSESEVVVLTFDALLGGHNGGSILFGPNDGYLYIPTGDGSGGCCFDLHSQPQDLTTPLGKILRIDVDSADPGLNYAIPPTNPFVGDDSALHEIWAYGLRNPFRSGFDRLTGDLYIGDVGQDAREEITFQPANSSGGENYGWSVFEGTRCVTELATQGECDGLAPSVVFPLLELPHPEAQSITGGFVYRGAAMPCLEGTYFFADFVTQRIWSFRNVNNTVQGFVERTHELDPTGESIGSVTAISEDGLGELYVVNIEGTVYRLAMTCQSPGVLVERPAGGETFVKGMTEELTWLSLGDVGANVSIRVRRAAASKTIANSTPNDGSFLWTIPNNLANHTDNYIEIRSVQNPLIVDQSGFFTLTDAVPEAQITATRPAAGDEYVKAQQHAITWSSVGEVGPQVSIRVRRGTASRVITNSTPNDGSFIWTVPTNLTNGSDNYIEVKSTLYPTIFDLGDFFTITDVASRPSITVLSPQGGEVFVKGVDAMSIQWSSAELSGDVMIRIKKGANTRTIAGPTADDGEFLWNPVPTNFNDGTNYLIEVSSVENPMVSDLSDAAFRLVSP